MVRIVKKYAREIYVKFGAKEMSKIQKSDFIQKR